MGIEKRTLGPIGSKLIMSLKVENKTIFSLKDAQEITGTGYEATVLLFI
jgi:hypothetical protein